MKFGHGYPIVLLTYRVVVALQTYQKMCRRGLWTVNCK